MTKDNTKHTPGPWAVGGQNGHCGISINGHERQVATVYLNCVSSEWKWGAQTLGQPVNAESVANAHLIAAAPELYEALADCYVLALAWASTYAESHELPMGEPYATIFKNSLAALRKAEGRS